MSNNMKEWIAVIIMSFIFISLNVLSYSICSNKFAQQKCGEVCYPYAVVDCEEKIAVCESASGKVTVDIK